MSAFASCPHYLGLLVVLAFLMARFVTVLKGQRYLGFFFCASHRKPWALANILRRSVTKIRQETTAGMVCSWVRKLSIEEKFGFLLCLILKANHSFKTHVSGILGIERKHDLGSQHSCGSTGELGMKSL